MNTKTVYILRVSPTGSRLSYRSGGVCSSSQGLDPRLGGGWSECSRCGKTVSHQSDYVIMGTSRSYKHDWWRDYVGSVCEDCAQTADEYGRVYIDGEEVKA